MDKYVRAWYEVVFERDFLRKKGTEFQNFFGDLMERRFPEGDFIRVRPWGNTGDRKNDGYLTSQRTLFQVYAPNEMKELEALRKIDEDFNGALPYWEQYFETWIFVHNARQGPGPGVAKKLLDLHQEHRDISVKLWGFEDLRRELFQMSEEDIAALLGPAPSQRDFLKVGFEDLKAVLQFISRQAVPSTPDLQRVPRDKVEINKLSEETEALISAGRHKSSLVGKFLKRYPDPEYGDQIVQAFEAKYHELRSDNLDPDSIFRELQIFAGGERTREPKHQAAVLSVLAYLFDQCDIFESVGDKRR
jgi:hypothetical protein